MRVIQIGDGDIDTTRFRHLLTAVMHGPVLDANGQASQTKRSWDTQRADGKIMRLFKGISREVVVRKSDTGEDIKRRDLNPGGGTIGLTDEQFEKLKTWWTRIDWPTYLIDEVEDCYDWWIAAPAAE